MLPYPITIHTIRHQEWLADVQRARPALRLVPSPTGGGSGGDDDDHDPGSPGAPRLYGRHGSLWQPLTLIGRIPRETAAVAAVLLATVLWGVSTPAGALALQEWPPLTLAWVRFAAALVVLLPLALRAGGQLALGPASAALGFFGVALFYAVHNVGLTATSGINATLILDGGAPVLTVLLGSLLLGERPHRRALLGLTLAVAGIVVVTGNGVLANLRALGLGDGLMLLAAALWAISIVFSRKLLLVENAVAVIAGSTLYGLIFLTPVTTLEFMTVAPRPTPTGWALAVFLGVGCSGATYLLRGFALTHLSVWRVAVVELLMPLIGVAAVAVMLHEPITTPRLLGGLLVLGGIVLATLPQRSRGEVRTNLVQESAAGSPSVRWLPPPPRVPGPDNPASTEVRHRRTVL